MRTATREQTRLHDQLERTADRPRNGASSDSGVSLPSETSAQGNSVVSRVTESFRARIRRIAGFGRAPKPRLRLCSPIPQPFGSEPGTQPMRRMQSAATSGALPRYTQTSSLNRLPGRLRTRSAPQPGHGVFMFHVKHVNRVQYCFERPTCPDSVTVRSASGR